MAVFEPIIQSTNCILGSHYFSMTRFDIKRTTLIIEAASVVK